MGSTSPRYPAGWLADIGEQQQIADTFLDLGMIPKHVDVLKAAPSNLA